MTLIDPMSYTDAISQNITLTLWKLQWQYPDIELIFLNFLHQVDTDTALIKLTRQNEP